MSAGCLLRLRGLPFSATEADLLSFLDGFDVTAVHIGVKNGKPTGEAYVQTSDAEEAARALKERQHENMGSRYIEIFVAGEADLVANTSGAPGAGPSLQGHVVRLRGLPFTSTAADVVSFFEGVETVGGEAGVVFTCTPDGRPTGEAYVEVASADALAAALGRHKEKIGPRYIEIFESSKGDMYQAVQQHGYFTVVGGRRRHHWHQQHGGGGGGSGSGAASASAGQYAPDSSGGGGAARGRGSQMDEMTNAFAGFGLSQRDMQVPGPPRWAAYATPGDPGYQQYGGVPPRQMQQTGAVMTPGGMRWRPGGQMQPGMQHFNPAPGPPPGKGGRGNVANGTRQSSGGGGMMGMDYGGGGQPLMFNPFMMQHPLMVQHQQQHPGAAWGAAGMMQQQGGAWYGGMQMGRGMHAQMGMATPYAAYPGYYQAQPIGRTGPSPHTSSGSHHQQYGARHQHTQSHAAAGSAHPASTVPPAPPPAAPPAAPAAEPTGAASQGAAPAAQSPADERPSSALSEPAAAALPAPATPE